MSRAREVSKIVETAVTDAELSSALENVTVDLSGYATINQLSASVGNIDVSSSLDSRIFISSASPSTPQNGQIWVDPTTASAPVISIYNNSVNVWEKPYIGRFNAYGGAITYSNGYKIHTFTSTSSFIVEGSKLVEFLIIGGGGGGGAGYYAGGGGAGGFLTGTTLCDTGSYAVEIGSGGNGSTNVSLRGSNGSDSVFNSFRSYGGGGGGSRSSQREGANGGSGGGAAWPSTTGGLGTSGQGNNGATTSSTQYGGSGGGAGAAGTSNTSPYGANGGIGSTSSITGTSTYYAGGGAAGSSDPPLRTGGLGGGGSAAITNSVASQSGSVNSGGGGGGGSSTDSGGSGTYERGANGGSGIVIIRYLT